MHDATFAFDIKALDGQDLLESNGKIWLVNDNVQIMHKPKARELGKDNKYGKIANERQWNFKVTEILYK
jgi:hypothetical protein